MYKKQSKPTAKVKQSKAQQSKGNFNPPQQKTERESEEEVVAPPKAYACSFYTVV